MRQRNKEVLHGCIEPAASHLTVSHYEAFALNLTLHPKTTSNMFKLDSNDLHFHIWSMQRAEPIPRQALQLSLDALGWEMKQRFSVSMHTRLMKVPFEVPEVVQSSRRLACITSAYSELQATGKTELGFVAKLNS